MSLRTATSWLGVYRYDSDENRLGTSLAVDFEMKLTWRWFGRFTGMIVESEQGVPEPAQIRGRLADKRIHFTKKYRSLWVVEQSGEIVRVPNQRPLVLHYEGEIVDRGRRIVGRWRSNAETRIIFGQRLWFPESMGTWEANPGAPFAAGGRN